MDIREKITSIFEKIDGNNRYYVLVGFMALVFLLDYFVLMRPQLAALGKINPEINAVSDNIKKAKADMKKLGIDSPNEGDRVMMLMWRPPIQETFEPINFTTEF